MTSMMAARAEETEVVPVQRDRCVCDVVGCERIDVVDFCSWSDKSLLEAVLTESSLALLVGFPCSLPCYGIIECPAELLAHVFVNEKTEEVWLGLFGGIDVERMKTYFLLS